MKTKENAIECRPQITKVFDRFVCLYICSTKRTKRKWVYTITNIATWWRLKTKKNKKKIKSYLLITGSEKAYLISSCAGPNGTDEIIAVGIIGGNGGIGGGGFGGEFVDGSVE